VAHKVASCNPRLRQCILGRCLLDGWLACCRPLPDNTQHSQQTAIHSPCGIQTHNLCK